LNCEKCDAEAEAYYFPNIDKEDRVYLCREHADEETDHVVYWLPPVCPKCKKPMNSVHVERAQGLVWDDESRRFKDDGQGAGECRCGECNQPIGGYGQSTWGKWFEEDKPLM
jgi:ribosomal protein L34E